MRRVLLGSFAAAALANVSTPLGSAKITVRRPPFHPIGFFRKLWRLNLHLPDPRWFWRGKDKLPLAGGASEVASRQRCRAIARADVKDWRRDQPGRERFMARVAEIRAQIDARSPQRA